ncbi:hypothetical protein QC763_0094560 [Podospora pseudopauciseta]|uniref:Uncharacterized protein n=1 Tax=Podospora pseudopauciseta TaxID=2093780 RepID=A0ABR0H4U6_9PEZI|nr:hypothetical protein QC763_0094560 [Podospora pseudopauciseta]
MSTAQNATTAPEEPILCTKCPHEPARMDVMMSLSHDPSNPRAYVHTGPRDNLVEIKEDITNGTKKIVTLVFEFPLRPHDPAWIEKRCRTWGINREIFLASEIGDPVR